MLKFLFGVATGWAAAWFLDPNDGARRRNETRDKAMKYARQGASQAQGTATQAAQQAKGAVVSAAPVGGRSDAGERLNDPALARKVESELFRGSDAPKEKVSINVQDGVVQLRGELDSQEQIDGLAAAARGVDGVQDVEVLLHVTGTRAPTVG